MTKSAAEVEAEVEASRGSLDRTVEALRDKMTPGQIFDEATRAMGGAGQQVFSKFVEQAKENPMPLAVMGLGLAWLMTSNRKSGASAYRETYNDEPRSFSAESGAGVGDRLQAAGDKASGLISEARDKVAGLKEQAADSGRRAKESLSSAASMAAERAQQYGQSAQRSFTNLLESEPLLIGAAGLLVGAAIGASLPPTETEDRLVGGLRDDLVEKGKDLAQSGMQQAGEVAQAAYGGLKSELERSADREGSVAERAEDAARSAVQSAQSQGQSQGPAS